MELRRTLGSVDSPGVDGNGVGGGDVDVDRARYPMRHRVVAMRGFWIGGMVEDEMN